MKYWDISYGKIIEGFIIFPSVSVNWAIFQVMINFQETTIVIMIFSLRGCFGMLHLAK